MRRYLAPLIILGILPLTFSSSQAVCPSGPAQAKHITPPCPTYTFDYGETRGAAVKVKLSSGATAVASVQEFAQGSFSAQYTEKPNPAQIDYTVGCITVIPLTGKTDKSCKILAGSSISFDPTLTSVTVSFSVASALMKNQEIVASLILTAAGPPTVGATPTLTRNDELKTFTLTRGLQVARPMNVVGSIRSWVIGGGAVMKTTSAKAFWGTDGRVWSNRGKNPLDP